jgi:hypothetical protein
MHRVVRTFDAQYKLLKLTGKNVETKNGINKRALGYLDGFIKAAMRAQQLDIASEHAFAVFRMFYEKVFEKEAGERYLEYWTRSINDDEMQNGAKIGALDFSYFSNNDRPPTGWYRCFRDDDDRAAKANME